jgi:hypothetical protein
VERAVERAVEREAGWPTRPAKLEIHPEEDGETPHRKGSLRGRLGLTGSPIFHLLRLEIEGGAMNTAGKQKDKEAVADAEPLRWSRHARQRKQQRGVCEADVLLVLEWGRVFRQRDGREACFVGRKEALQAEKQGVNLQRVQNLGIVMGDDGGIITTIRSSDCRRMRRWGR